MKPKRETAFEWKRRTDAERDLKAQRDTCDRPSGENAGAFKLPGRLRRERESGPVNGERSPA